MALLNWNDSFNVNIKLFDSQHKQLFDLINQLHDAMMVGKGKEIMENVLKSLINYTNTHFADEERLLKFQGYPDLERQVTEHRLFVLQIAEFQKKYTDGNAAITQVTLNFLRDWLQNHIKVEDKKYSEFLIAKGVN